MSDIRKAIHSRISEGPRKEIIEGLDTPVYFRRMRMDDYIAIRELNELNEAGKAKALPRILATLLCDESGKAVYDAANEDDMNELGALDLSMLVKLNEALNKSPN